MQRLKTSEPSEPNVPLKFSPSKSNNPVWQYYEKCTTEEKARCTKCGSLISCKGSSTGAMRGHLKAKHDIEVELKIKPRDGTSGDNVATNDEESFD